MVGTLGVTVSRPSRSLKCAIELDLHRFGRPNNLPRIGTDQPVIRMLDLPAVLDLLTKHAVLVAQAIADCRDLQGCHRIEKACGQPAEPAISQPRVGLLVEQRLPVLPGIGREVIADELFDLQIADVVRQRPANQKLHRQVVHFLGILGVVCAARSTASAGSAGRESSLPSPRIVCAAFAFSSGTTWSKTR